MSLLFAPYASGFSDALNIAKRLVIDCESIYHFTWCEPRPCRAMISGVFIYNHKGDCIISRIYRDDITCVLGGYYFCFVFLSHRTTKIKTPNFSSHKSDFMTLFHIYITVAVALRLTPSGWVWSTPASQSAHQSLPLAGMSQQMIDCLQWRIKT